MTLEDRVHLLRQESASLRQECETLTDVLDEALRALKPLPAQLKVWLAGTTELERIQYVISRIRLATIRAGGVSEPTEAELISQWSSKVKPPPFEAFVTTTDICSNCGAKLKNAETSRLEYQAEAFRLSKEVKRRNDIIQRCLETGSLRTDRTRELYVEACRAVGREPYEVEELPK